MSNVFVSYSRHTEAPVRTLADDLEALGHSSWFDGELGGGQAWWDEILENIRECDIFVIALDSKTWDSTAVKAEWRYANELSRLIVPVVIAEGVSKSLFPPALTRIQFVDYWRQDRRSAFDLARALKTDHARKPLPDPLPAPPEMPVSELSRLYERIETPLRLQPEEQSEIVTTLRRMLRQPDSANDAVALLKTLGKRRDLLADTAADIDELLRIQAWKAPVSPEPTRKSVDSSDNGSPNEADF